MDGIEACIKIKNYLNEEEKMNERSQPIPFVYALTSESEDNVFGKILQAGFKEICKWIPLLFYVCYEIVLHLNEENIKIIYRDMGIVMSWIGKDQQQQPEAVVQSNLNWDDSFLTIENSSHSEWT